MVLLHLRYLAVATAFTTANALFIYRPRDAVPEARFSVRDAQQDATSVQTSTSADTPFEWPNTNETSTWKPANITSTNPAHGGVKIYSSVESLPMSLTGRPAITIDITQTGARIPEDQIFVGLIASLSLLFVQQLGYDEKMPSTGVVITFTPGLQHSIALDPFTGQQVTWGVVDLVLKQLGQVVFNRHLSTEIIFTASYGGSVTGAQNEHASGRPFLRGVISNSKAGASSLVITKSNDTSIDAYVKTTTLVGAPVKNVTGTTTASAVSVSSGASDLS